MCNYRASEYNFSLTDNEVKNIGEQRYIKSNKNKSILLILSVIYLLIICTTSAITDNAWIYTPITVVLGLVVVWRYVLFVKNVTRQGKEFLDKVRK